MARSIPRSFGSRGGECNTIGDVWSPQPSSNDQSASAYRQAGIVMMFPSLRGGNQNPGHIEGFYGEVNDVLAAAAQLAVAKYVDPERIYLGGHSTGGTLVMLCAAASNKFRAVFSFGLAHDVAAYGGEYTPINIFDRKEVDLRSPIKWLHSIQSPVFVFEGTTDGNLIALQEMQRVNKNPLVQFFPIDGHDHFSVLDPINRVIAQKILADTGEKTNITFTPTELTGR
jgi:pimeloyl-ACP methyl ester carboxylesterase